MKRFRTAALAALASCCAMAGDNLFFNSSFELGLDGWANNPIKYPYPEKGLRVDPRSLDVKDAVHGKASFRLELGGTYVNSWVLTSPDVHLKPGKKYTVSFYAKADTPTGASFSLHTNHLSHWGSASGFHYVSFNKEWKRHQFSFTNNPKGAFTRPGFDRYFLLMLPKNEKNVIHFDAFQIEEGEMTDYKPAFPVEYKVALPTAYLEDKPEIAAEVTGISYARDAVVTENIVLRDEVRQKTVAEVPAKFDFKAGVPQKQTVKMDRIPYGYFRVQPANRPAECSMTFVRIHSNNAVYQPGKFAVGTGSIFLGLFNNQVNGHLMGDRYVAKDYTDDDAKIVRMSGAVFTQSYTCVPGTFAGIAPKGRGQYDWSLHDMYYKKCREWKLASVYTICAQALFLRADKGATGHVPDWVAKLDTTGHPEGARHGEWGGVYTVLPPPELFGETAEAMVKRYGKSAFLFRLFAEANGYIPADILAKYAQEVYTRVKKVEPSILVNSVTPTEDQGIKMGGYFYDFLKAGGGKYCDVYGFHPYGSAQDDSPLSAMDSIAAFRTSMTALKVPRMLADLECFYLHKTRPEAYGEAGFFPAENVARRLLIDMGEGLGLSAPLELGQLHISCPATESAQGFFIRYPDGRFAAHNAMGHFLNGAENGKRIPMPGSTLCYTFRNRNRPYSTVWNIEGKSQMILNLPAGVSYRVFDIFGNEIKSGTKELNIVLGREPRIIEWSANADADAIHKAGRYVREEMAVIHGLRVMPDGIGVMLTNTSGKPLSGMLRLNSPYLSKKRVSFRNLEPDKPLLLTVPCGIAKDAPEKFKASVVLMANGKMFTSAQKLTRVPVIKVGRLPQKFQAGPHSFTLKKDGKLLKIKAFVKRSKVTAPKDPRNAWDGDCAEFFCDFNPENYNARKPENYTASCVQLVVPGWKDGKAAIQSLPSGRSNFGSQASVRTVPGGFEVNFSVPFAENMGLTAHFSGDGKTTVWRGVENFRNRSGFAVLSSGK